MIKINWKQDYQREFICPNCHQIGLRLYGKSENGGRRFYCSSCRKRIGDSCQLKTLIDPKTKIVWHRRERIDGFVCPNLDCNSQDICFAGFAHGKTKFRCRACGKTTFDSIEITSGNLSRYAQGLPQITAFSFENDQWDLRTLLSSFDAQAHKFIVNFENIPSEWWKILVKQFIYHLCQSGKSFGTIDKRLSSLRIFSRYLQQRNIRRIDELRGKESRAKANGQDVLVEQFGRQADQLDKIIASLEGAA